MIEDRLRLLEEARVPPYQLDARDYHQLSNIMGLFAPEIVIHLAAVAHLNIARKSPHTTFDHSLRTLENALDISVALNVERFVFFSSSTVYGDFENIPIREDAKLRPKGTYGSLKLAGELLVKSYQEDAGLVYTIVRPQALYGPRCISGRVLQVFIENVLDGKPIEVNGANETIDFTHVGDVIRFVQLVIGSDAARNETFNVSAGCGRTIGDAADLVWRRFPEAVIVKKPFDDYRPKRGTMDLTKARTLLGYEPEFNLEMGLDSYIDWYQQWWFQNE